MYVWGNSGTLLEAWYGEPKVAWQDGRSCLEEVRSQVESMGCVLAQNELLGDPAPGQRKVLLLKVRGQPGPSRGLRVKLLAEGATLHWSASAVASLNRAWYGDPEQLWREGSQSGYDCLQEVAVQLQRSDRVQASNDVLGGDPCPGRAKVLLLEYRGSGPREIVHRPKLYASPSDVPGDGWLAFIRHAQAGHNVDSALLETADNCLTEAGRAQASEAAAGRAGDAVREAELVITSPLTRALETTSLLVADAPVRVAVDALGTERHAAGCDAGSPRSLLLAKQPRTAQWEGWDELQEEWWPERGEDWHGRAEAFVAMLRSRPEKRIALVGHGAFWQLVIGKYLNNCDTVYCDRQFSD